MDEVEIDVIAGFVIVDNGMEHDCSLKPDQITEVYHHRQRACPFTGIGVVASIL